MKQAARYNFVNWSRKNFIGRKFFNTMNHKAGFNNITSGNMLSLNENSISNTPLDPLLTPVDFSHSKINKNAFIIENSHYYTKIIFPEYKFSLVLDLSKEDYTIKNMLEDSRKIYNKDLVLSLSFFDTEGDLIANSVQVKMLTRLPSFKICIDNGDRVLNCLNPFWSGNESVDSTVKDSEITSKNLDLIEKLMFEKNLSFKVAQSLVIHNQISKNENNKIYPPNSPTYRSILNEYVNTKYLNLKNFTQSLSSRREQRLQKFLNFFYYMCLSQTLALNMCTFVFFSWDFMEPVTQCITYLNLIIGYYFWASTNVDYEMESMLNWARTRKYLTKPEMWRDLLEEKEEIKKLLK